jgi:hypothetical protein
MKTVVIGLLLASMLAFVFGSGEAVVAEQPAPTTIGWQPMTDGGLTAGLPFEAWIDFGSSNPAVEGYSLPAGASIRITFPQAFTPESGVMQGVVLLNGWPQNAIDIPFSFAYDPSDPRTLVITLKGAIAANLAAGSPGLKAIHLRTDERNPAPGDYPIKIAFVNAGASNGTVEATAHIYPERVPNIAQYNQLHPGQADEDWQHVRPGQMAPVPVDLLVTRNDAPRATLQLAKRPDGGLNVMADGKPIGTIEAHGVPVTLVPHPFGPGFARLGIVEFNVQAGQTPGNAEIEAKLDGGTMTTIHVIVD